MAMVADSDRRTLNWVDLVWLAFLTGLALLQPLFEVHKQLTLLGLGLYQIFEHRFVRALPKRGPAYSVLIKIVLASVVVNCTGGIESSYYLIYFLPVVTAAMFFSAGQTLLWTALTSAAYLAFLIPALQVYDLTPEGATELAIRNLFFFLAAIVINRFVLENRHQSQRYRELAETLELTNRQLAQAQEEKRRTERLAALGQLSAGLAHELRNPLAIIKGSSEMLTKRNPSGDGLTAELAENISGEVNRLNTLITRFLNFARPSELHLRPEPLAPLIDRALKRVHDQWPDARVVVERHYHDGLPPIPLDADLCEQVFTNLFLNAYEAMEANGGTLRVAMAPANANGRKGVEIEIADSGSGVSPELMTQIFNPFFTTKKAGVGLGLSIVSKIIDDHRGSVRVSSDPGKGTCFRVFLPGE
jgi:signal transduction histidine kinase